MRRWVWVSSVLAPVFLIGGWTLAQLRQPHEYDAVRETISALAAHGARDAWIMTAGLAGLGVSHLITAAGFRAAGRAARVIWAVGGTATVVVAASPQPAAAHVPAAAVGFITLAIWPAVANHGILRIGRWFVLVMLGLLLWFAIALATATLVGVSERALAGAEAITPLGILLLSRPRTSR